MKRPRYSIIPAGAVTDPTLEGRDLQVLCFLGIHTDKLGWCFLSQGGVADAINCGRSSVQRSLSRLIDAGWVQVKSHAVGSRTHACHAYRVLMDRDDDEIVPDQSDIEAQVIEERCPPVGTSPPARGHLDPPVGGGAQPYMGTERPSLDADGGGCARAREGSYSPEAHALSAELARACGHDLAILPGGWARDGAWVAQAFIEAGYSREMMFDEVRVIMARKQDEPPQNITYFRKPFARAHAQRSSPHQLPQVQVSQPQESIHAKTSAAGDWPPRRNGGGFAAFARERAKSAGGA